jgi:electron-transferring-flavoprotein dehydrogenase
LPSTHHSEFKPIDYPTPDGILSFDILTSVSRTGTNHAENQPIHLHIKDSARAAHVKENVGEYAGLLGRVCPAAVYEYVEAEGEEADAVGQKLVINSQNCIHCKTCSIKVSSLASLPPSRRSRKPKLTLSPFLLFLQVPTQVS